MRNISSFERIVIEGVAKRLFSHDASKLLNDLKFASVDDLSSDSNRIYFVIDGYCRPSYEGQHQYPVEIRLNDMDGTDVTAILYADANGHLYELEFIKWGGEESFSPNVESISFY